MNGEVCIANIGPRQRRARGTVGWVGIALAGVLVAVALGLGLPAVMRLVPSPLFFLGFLGVLQAKEKT